MHISGLLLALALFPLWTSAWAQPAASPAAKAVPPTVVSLLKPSIYKRVLDREIMVHAGLDEPHYSYYVAMTVRTELARARAILTNYALYAKMIPYVDSAEFNASTHILEIEGGIWKFKLKSSILFEEQSERWIKYRIVRGHFTGLTGDILFEPGSDEGRTTVVLLRGELDAENWPPRFVIEQGAEIVFGYTATRMRSYVESPESGLPSGRPGTRPPAPKGTGGPADGDQIPQPRSHI